MSSCIIVENRAAQKVVMRYEIAEEMYFKKKTKRIFLKKVMKNYIEKQRKTSTSLPLEGGGRRVGVKE